MYNHAKLSNETLRAISNIAATGANRCEIFPVAVGYTVARLLSIPTEKVEDISTYYRLNATSTILSFLDSINECLPFNTRSGREAVEAFYLHRYYSLYPLAIPLALRKDHGLCDFFGLSKIFSDDTLCLIEKESEKLTNLVNALTLVVNDLNAAVIQRATELAIEQESDKHVAQ